MPKAKKGELVPMTKQEACIAAEKRDEEMIRAELKGEDPLLAEFFYTVKGDPTPHLSYAGVKHIIILMSRTQPMEVLESRCELVKYEDNPDTWAYEAYYKVRNKTTGHESDGYAAMEYRNDPGRFHLRMAISKAKRNALGEQIPKSYIEDLVKKSGKVKTKELSKSAAKKIAVKPGAVAPKRRGVSGPTLARLKAAGYDGDTSMLSEEGAAMLASSLEAGK